MRSTLRILLCCLVMLSIFGLTVHAQQRQARSIPASVNVNEEGVKALPLKVSPPSQPTVSGTAAIKNVPVPFATIQAAIDDPGTVDGDIIQVAAGTYIENVIVSKSVTISGAGAGSRSSGRRSSARTPAVRSLAVGHSTLFLVRAHNVTIDNLTDRRRQPGIDQRIGVRWRRHRRAKRDHGRSLRAPLTV